MTLAKWYFEGTFRTAIISERSMQMYDGIITYDANYTSMNLQYTFGSRAVWSWSVTSFLFDFRERLTQLLRKIAIDTSSSRDRTRKKLSPAGPNNKHEERRNIEEQSLFVMKHSIHNLQKLIITRATTQLRTELKLNPAFFNSRTRLVMPGLRWTPTVK